MRRHAAVPFNLRRSKDVFSATTITSTTEVIHGLVTLDGDRLMLQWRLSRTTEHMGGASYHTENEMEAVREIVLSLGAMSGAVVRRSWWRAWSPRLVLRAADLRAFEAVAGEGGLKQEHPAEIVLRLRRADVLAAEEFAAELALALAERAIGEVGDGMPRLGGTDRRTLPGSAAPSDTPAEEGP